MTNQHTSRSWADERIERLKLLWMTTGQSSGQIAQEFGITRNAVIGKLHRLGLSMADRPSSEGASLETILRQRRAQALKEAGARERHAAKLALRRQKWAEKTLPNPPIEPEPIPLPQPPSGQRPLLSLAKGECRWPSGHGTIAEPFLFCGATQAEGSSYCPRHSDEAYGTYARPGGGLTPRLTTSYPLARKAG